MLAGMEEGMVEGEVMMVVEVVVVWLCVVCGGVCVCGVCVLSLLLSSTLLHYILQDCSPSPSLLITYQYERSCSFSLSLVIFFSYFCS